MAKREASSAGKAKSKPAAKSAPKPAVVKKVAAEKTPVRNTAIPKAAKPAGKAPKVITYEMISERAYLISQSPACGSQDDNWHRAVGELNDEKA